MSGTDVRVGVVVDDGGSTKKVTDGASLLSKGLDNVTASANRASAAVKAAMAPTGGSKTGSAIQNASMPSSDLLEYNQAKGIAGATGASSRDFAKQAQGLGGLVHIYATFAANLFAVSAAFTALKNAADTDNMVKGLDQLGARSGVALGSLSKRLVDATDGAISLRDAMTATAQASAAGMSTDSIERLAKVARNAGNALGIDASEALSRLSRGVSKLEPELLDELGIFIRIDDVVSDYARSIGKASSAITDFEKRQAVAQAVLKQGEDKFGNLQIDANPFQKLLSTVENVAHSILSVVNSILGPVAKYLSESPNIVLGVLTMLTGYLIQKAVPAIAQYSNAVSVAAEKELLLNKATSEAVTATFKAKQKQLSDSKALYESIETDIEKIIDRTSAAEMKALGAKGSRSSKVVKDILQNAPTYSAADIPPEKLAIIDALAAKNTKMAQTYKELALGIRQYQAAEEASIQASKDKAVASEILAAAERDLTAAKANLLKINTALAVSEAKQKASSAGGLVSGFSTLFGELGKLDISKFEKVKAGVTGGVGLIGSSLSKALNFVNPWIMGITAAIAIWDIADGVFSKNAKELAKLNSSLEGLDESLKSTSRTIETYATLDVTKALPLERTKAMSAALNDLSSATSRVIADFKDMVAQGNMWDKSKEAVLSVFGLDKQTDVAKKVSSSLAKALALADEGPAKEAFKKKVSEITGSTTFSEKTLATSLGAKSTEDFSASVTKLAEAEAELNKVQSTSTARTVELSDAFKASEKAFDTFAQSIQSNNPLASFANTLVQQSMKISTALEDPIKAIDNLVELGSKTKQLSLLNPDTVAELKNALPVINRINKDLKTAQQELTKKQEERSQAVNPEDQRFLDSRIAALKDDVAKFSQQAQIQTQYFLTKIQTDGFAVAASILSKEILQATKQAGLEMAKARLPLLTNERAAEQQGRIAEAQLAASLTLAETNRDLIRAQYLSIAALKENTAKAVLTNEKSTETERARATSDITAASIQTGMLQSANPIAAYQQLTSKGMPDEVRASANEVFQQVQNLSSFTKTIIELKGQLAATKETTKINVALGEVKSANEVLEATNKTKQAELDRLQAVSQIVGFSTQEQLAAEKQLADEIAINQQKIQTSVLEKTNALLKPSIAVEAKEIEANNRRLADIRKQSADAQFKRDMDYAKKTSESILYLAKIQADADLDRLETQSAQKKNAQELLDVQLQAAQQLGRVDEKTKANLDYAYGVSKAKADFDYQQGKQRIEQEQKFADFEARRAQVAMAPGVDLDTKIAQLAEINKQETDYIALQGAKIARDAEGYNLLLKKLGINKDTTLELFKQKEAMDSLTRVTESLASVFGSVGKAIGDTATELYKSSKAQSDLSEQRKLALKDVKDEGKIKEINADFDRKSTKEEVAGYAKIAGAAKGMFKEKSAGYKVFSAMEKAAHLMTIALELKTFAIKTGLWAAEVPAKATAEAGVTAAGAAGAAARAPLTFGEIIGNYLAKIPPPFGMIAGVAAGAYFLSLLGKSGGGGSQVDMTGLTSADRQATQGTGQAWMADNTGKLVKTDTGNGVFGDSEAKSTAIVDSLEVMKKNSIEGLDYDNRMLKALEKLADSVVGAAKSLYSIPGLRQGTNFGTQAGTTSSGGFGSDIPIVGKLLGSIFGGGTSSSASITSAGIQLKGSFTQVMNDTVGSIMQYKDVLTQFHEDGGWFGSDSDWSTLNRETDKLKAEVSTSISDIFKDANKLFIALGEKTGVSVQSIQDVLNKFDISMPIDIMNLKGQELLDELNAVIGAKLSEVGKTIFTGFDKYKNFGEDYLATVIRVVDGSNKVDQALRSIGHSFSVIQKFDISEALIKAAGGLDNFMSQADFFRQNFLSDAEQLAPIRISVAKEMSRLGISLSTTREGFKKLVLAQNLSTDSGIAMYQALMDLAPGFDTVINGITNGLDATKTKLQDTASAFTDFAKNIKAFREGLILSAASIATPEEKLAAARSQFESTYAAALGGDKVAMGNVVNTAQTLLDLGKSFYASSDEYAKLFNYISDKMGAAEVSALASVDVAQLQLNAINTQVSLLTEINANIATIAGVPAAAGGGRVSGLTLVGEMGPELVDFSTPGRVYNADQTAGMFVAGNGNVGQQQLIQEVRNLRQEVAKLREQQNTETGHIINATYDAQAKNAEQVTDGVAEAAAKQAWADSLRQSALIN